MKDRRSVDDLTIEELEQILRIRKRQARMDRLRRFEHTGRRRGDLPTPTEPGGAEEGETGGLHYESFLNEEPGSAGKRRRSLRDHLLLGVEIAAALGIFVILVFTAMSFQDLNREAATAQRSGLEELPTASPTPLITTVVLPGGHIVSPQGVAQPNYNELPDLPAHLRPLVEQSFSAPVFQPTPRPGYATQINIRAIRVKAPVVPGTDWEALKQGVGQVIGTPNPGENGNIVLAGHNDVYGEVFRYLEELEEGDEIELVTSTGQRFIYRVSYKHFVLPDEVSVMDQTPDPIVTLISCHPYLINTHRIIVVAELLE